MTASLKIDILVLSMEHSSGNSHSRTLHIHGMTCRSCALLVQETLLALPGVYEVQANVSKHLLTLRTETPDRPTLEELNDALSDTHFSVSLEAPAASKKQPKHSTANSSTANSLEHSLSAMPHWLEIVYATLAVVLGWFILKQLGFAAPSPTSGGAVALGAVFVMGLVAACSSCLALVGGLLLSVSAKWTSLHPHASGWEKFKPMLAFNAGRLAGYFFLGGIVGLIGKAIGLSTGLTGMFTLIAAVTMIVIGLNILHVLPKRYCSIPLPKAMWDRIATLSKTKSTSGAIVLGALTFFLPCGFTQSTQLLALSSGSFTKGALIMLAFALGTLPTLLGISALSSYLHGKAARFFLIFSGVAILVLGFQNLQSGLVLTGWHIPSFGNRAVVENDPYVSIAPDGRQVITLYVADEGYTPNSFTISPGRETWVYAIAQKPLTNCATFIQAPAFQIASQVNVGGNWLGPIENPTQDFLITCSMGMLKADVHVKKS